MRKTFSRVCATLSCMFAMVALGTVVVAIHSAWVDEDEQVVEERSATAETNERQD